MRIATVLSSLCFTAAAFVLIAGCARITVESTAALYNPRTDLAFDPRLLGVWLPDTMCVNLRRGEGNAYLAGSGAYSWLVVFGDAGNNAPKPTEIHLVKIGKYVYFFAAPKERESGTAFTGCCKVELMDGRIILHGLNLQTVADDLLKHPDALKHEWKEEPLKFGPATRPTTQSITTTSYAATTQQTGVPTTEKAIRNGDLKITDDPPAIRAYLIRHQDDAEFFNDPIVLYRIAK